MSRKPKKPKICPKCGKHHTKTRKFCSHTCRLKSEKRVGEKDCLQCGKPFKVQLSTARWQRAKYCCLACKILAEIKNPPSYKSGKRGEESGRRSGQSKDEWLSAILLQKNKIEAEPQNRSELNGLEIDLWIEHLNIGIELNGPVHYRPIFGLERLSQAQLSDRRKRQRALERGILILTLDVSQRDPQPFLNLFWLGFLLEFQGRSPLEY